MSEEAKVNPPSAQQKVPQFVAELARATVLENVVLSMGSVVNHGFDKADKVDGVAMDVGLGVARGTLPGVFQLIANLRFDFKPTPEAERVLVRCECNYVLSYKAPHAETLKEYSDDQLSEFGKLNGMFHVWPYAREFCQGMGARLQSPPLLLPPYRHQLFGRPWAADQGATLTSTDRFTERPLEPKPKG